MNARQKAKHYKQLYELCRHNTVIPKVDISYKRLEKIMYRHSLPAELMEENQDMALEFVKKKFAFELATKFDDFITIETKYDPYTGQYRVECEIEVASKY